MLHTPVFEPGPRSPEPGQKPARRRRWLQSYTFRRICGKLLDYATKAPNRKPESSGDRQESRIRRSLDEGFKAQPELPRAGGRPASSGKESPAFVTRLTASCEALELRLSLQSNEFGTHMASQERHNRLGKTRWDPRGKAPRPGAHLLWRCRSVLWPEGSTDYELQIVVESPIHRCRHGLDLIRCPRPAPRQDNGPQV